MKSADAITHIVDVLQPAVGEQEAKNISRIILEDAFALSYPFVSGEVDKEKLEIILHQVKSGHPIQYVLGSAHFYGFDLKVNEHVLIPRPETEELLYSVFEHYKNRSRPLRILDIGTGSACIPVVLKSKFPDAAITAIDVSSEALKVASFNVENQGFSGVGFKCLDFLDRGLWNQVNQSWDLIISNPPYIPKAEKKLMTASTVAHEPHLALFTNDAEGQEFYMAIAEFAKAYLNPEGVVFCELNEYWSKTTIEHFKNQTFQSVSCIKDMQGKERILKASLT